MTTSNEKPLFYSVKCHELEAGHYVIHGSELGRILRDHHRIKDAVALANTLVSARALYALVQLYRRDSWNLYETETGLRVEIDAEVKAVVNLYAVSAGNHRRFRFVRLTDTRESHPAAITTTASQVASEATSEEPEMLLPPAKLSQNGRYWFVSHIDRRFVSETDALAALGWISRTRNKKAIEAMKNWKRLDGYMPRRYRDMPLNLSLWDRIRGLFS